MDKIVIACNLSDVARCAQDKSKEVSLIEDDNGEFKLSRIKLCKISCMTSSCPYQKFYRIEIKDDFKL